MLRITWRSMSLCVMPFFFLMAWPAKLRAETVQTVVPLSSSNEFPPITSLMASGTAQVSIEITRDPAGNITNAKMNLLVAIAFPASVTVQGLHLHEGDSRTNGVVQFDSDLSSSNSLTFSTGEGVFSREITNVNLTVLQRLLTNAAGFYVNLHTSAHPSGAIRGQLTRFSETLARTTLLSPANLVPPITNSNATGTATLTLNPTRNTKGEILSANITFSVAYDFSAAVTITGLFLSEGVSGSNGALRFSAGLSINNPIVTANGKGIFSQNISITSAAGLAVLARLLNSPAGFYVTLQTSGGSMRGQLDGSFALPPIILQSSAYALTNGNAAVTVNLLAVNLDAASTPLINGQVVPFGLNFNTGQIALPIPAELRAAGGVLALQIRSGQGVISAPVFLNIQTSETAATVVDAAGYGTSVAPESIATIFGTGLATRTLALTTATLPSTLDGTTVYVNGLPAPLFFVSPGQINFQLPEGLTAGAATVVVRNTVSGVALARLEIVNVSPGVFTRLANGKGAPAAVASNDNGQTYTIMMANADGTPVELQVGNIAVLFGTGFRFLSGQPAASAAGVNLVPTYAGTQGQFVGLDQINLFIPEELRGKGETDLIFNLDGKITNAIRIKVR